MGGRAFDAEEQQREVDVGPPGVNGQRGGVEAAVARLQGGEHQTQSRAH